MAIERVYGVTHDIVRQSLFGDTEVVPVNPSTELIAYLESLPPGFLVGVETFRELYTNDASPISRWDLPLDILQLDIPVASENYWARVVRVCKEHGLNVVFLDDLNTFKNYHEKLREASHYGHKLYGHEDYPPRRLGQTQEEIALEERDLREKIHRAESEASYIHIFERESHIKKNILKHSPGVVIVGLGHADFFCLGEGFLARKGLNSSPTYKKEVVLPDGTRQVTLGALADPDMIIHRELVQRNYNATTSWRVFPERTPNFIGTFNSDCRTEGLFEIYLSSYGSQIIGVSEDCFGRARIEGEITTGGVHFTKLYEREWTVERSLFDRHAIPSPIVYQGVFRNGRYYGEWETPRYRGDFVLFKGARFDHAN